MKSVKAIDANKAYKHIKHFLKALNNNNTCTIGATTAADSNTSNNNFNDSKKNYSNSTASLAEFEDSFHDDLKSKLNIILESLKEYKTKNNNNNDNDNVVVHSSTSGTTIINDSIPALTTNLDAYSADHSSSVSIDIGTSSSSSSSKKVRSKRKAEVATASTPVQTKKIKVEHNNDTSTMAYATASKAAVAAAVALADSTDSKPDVVYLTDAIKVSNVKNKKRRTEEVILLSTKGELNDMISTADGDHNDDAGKLKSMKKLLKQQHKI